VPQRAQGQAPVDRQGHVGGEQRVPAEQRHEPRRPGGDDGQRGVVRVVDAQRADVLLAAPQHPLQPLVPRRGERGAPLPAPSPQRRRRLAHRPVQREGGLHDLAVDHRVDQQGRRPLPARRHDDVVADAADAVVRAGGAERPPGRLDHRAPARAAPVLLQDQPFVVDLCVPLAARLHAPLLDLEEVGEVGLDLDRHGARRRLARGVADDQVLAHAVADPPVALDQEVGVGPPGAARQPADERRPVGVRGQGRERLRRRPVHRQVPARQDPGVAEEDAVRALGTEVPAGCADAERRPLDQGHRPGSGAGRSGVRRPGAHASVVLRGSRCGSRSGAHPRRTRVLPTLLAPGSPRQWVDLPMERRVAG
jgi:hypothetical protein